MKDITKHKETVNQTQRTRKTWETKMGDEK